MTYSARAAGLRTLEHVGQPRQSSFRQAVNSPLAVTRGSAREIDGAAWRGSDEATRRGNDL
jgi:hypothetical protein